MSKVLVNSDSLTNVAEAIRTKTSTTDKLTLDKMATAIQDIPSGGDLGNVMIFNMDHYTSGNVLSAVQLSTNIDCSNMDTSKVTNMKEMFRACKKLTTLDLSSFNTSNVTSMYNMFAYCSSLTTLDLSNFDTSNVTDMSGMFYECSSLTTLDLSNFDTSNVTSMYNMFSGCDSLTSLDLSNWDTSKVTNTNYMFSYCGALTTIYVNSSSMKTWVTNRAPDGVKIVVKES